MDLYSNPNNAGTKAVTIQAREKKKMSRELICSGNFHILVSETVRNLIDIMSHYLGTKPLVEQKDYHKYSNLYEYQDIKKCIIFSGNTLLNANMRNNS